MSKVKIEMEGGEKELLIPGGDPERKNEEEPLPSSAAAVEYPEMKPFDTLQRSLAIFPEELWEMVLNSVDDSKSLYNVFLANPKLLDMFKEKIPLWLFGQVFPHLLPYLNKKDVQICTHVCRTWRREIFEFAEEHGSLRAYNEKEGNTVGRSALFPLGSKFSVNKLKVTFETSDSIQTFLRIGPNQMNPFIGRNLTLSSQARNDADVAQFNSSAKLLLQKYGKYIWHFEIKCHFCLESGSQFFRRLILSLSLLPNLRSLSVVTAESEDVKPASAPYRLLPPLLHLESLRMRTWDGHGNLDSGPITLAVLRRYVSERLHYLSISMESCGWEGRTCICDIIDEICFSGLTELQTCRNFHWNSAQNHIQKLLSHLPRQSLQKMDFLDDAMVEPETFQNLSGFQVGMVELYWSPFWLGKYCNKDCESSKKCTTWDNTTINLPNLHSLCIKQHAQFSSYKFLAKIPTLQNLDIVVYIGAAVCNLEEDLLKQRKDEDKDYLRFGCHYDQITEEINKWIYQDAELDRSLLWKILPGLQVLKIRYSFVKKMETYDWFNMPRFQRVDSFHRKEFLR